VDRREIEAICTERLDEWKKDLVEAHSTPVLMLAVGHDHVSGEIHILIPEDITTQQVRQFLVYAVGAITQGNVKQQEK
jgi:hypothetical protein